MLGALHPGPRGTCTGPPLCLHKGLGSLDPSLKPDE